MNGPVEETRPSGGVDGVGLEAEMDSEFAALRKETPGARRHPRNPVYLHEQAAGSAVAADEAAEDARGVTGNRFLHRGRRASGARRMRRALADERTAAADLVELDALERRVEDDGGAGS